MLLKVLVIILGVVVAASRAVGVVSPAICRRVMQRCLDRPVFIYIMGLVAAIFGAVVFWAARVEVHDGMPLARAIWAILLGILVCAMGLAVLIVPTRFTGMLSNVMSKSDDTLRALMTVGLIVGLAILALGIWVY